MKRLLTACLLSLTVTSCIVGKNEYAPPLASAARRQALAPPRFKSEQRWGSRAENRWEPVVAADPASSWVYQMTTDQLPDSLIFRASQDGGRTWLPTRHICLRGVRVPFQYDPQIAVSSSGAVDVICLNGFRPGVVFTQSRDHGRSWSRTVRLDAPLRYSDKPTLVLSSSGKDVYVAFSGGEALYVASSHDGGASWQQPVKATSEHLWYYPYSGTAARDGSVWFAVDGEAGHDQTGDGHVELVTSSDGGATWRTIPFAVSREGARCRGHECYPDFFTAQDAIAVDRSGAYVFVFAKNASKQGPNALYESRSRNGVRWSVPSAINTLGNNTSPAIKAGPVAGEFRLVWQDNRNGPYAWNTWYAKSTDAGVTWSDPVRLSDRVSGEKYKGRAGYDFPFGDYLSLAVDSRGVDHVIWGEGAGVYYPGSTWWTRD
ncbi:MAG: sialidase family protein [Candidatus Cybelea sp.]